MPIAKYDPEFGGDAGSAEKAYDAMKSEYGDEKGERVFYATKNRNKKRMAGRKVARRSPRR